MDLKASHHFLLLWQTAHEFSHVLQRHVRRISLASVNDALNLAVNVIEGLKEVHVAQLDPQLVLVIQVHRLIVYLDETVGCHTIFDVYCIGLIEEVVDDR